MFRGTYHGNNYVIVPCASQESERQHTDTLGSPVFECIRKKDISISSTTDSTLDTCTNLERFLNLSQSGKIIFFSILSEPYYHLLSLRVRTRHILVKSLTRIIVAIAVR